MSLGGQLYVVQSGQPQVPAVHPEVKDAVCQGGAILVSGEHEADALRIATVGANDVQFQELPLSTADTTAVGNSVNQIEIPAQNTTQAIGSGVGSAGTTQLAVLSDENTTSSTVAGELQVILPVGEFPAVVQKGCYGRGNMLTVQDGTPETGHPRKFVRYVSGDLPHGAPYVQHGVETTGVLQGTAVTESDPDIQQVVVASESVETTGSSALGV